MKPGMHVHAVDGFSCVGETMDKVFDLIKQKKKLANVFELTFVSETHVPEGSLFESSTSGAVTAPVITSNERREKQSSEESSVSSSEDEEDRGDRIRAAKHRRRMRHLHNNQEDNSMDIAIVNSTRT